MGYTRIMNLEQPPAAVPLGHKKKKPKEESSRLKKVLNMAVAAAHIAGASGFAANASAQEKLASITPLSQDVKKEKGDTVSFEKTEQSVLSYMRGLSVFGKLALVNEVKEHGDAIKSFLRGDINDTERTQTIFAGSGVELKTILSIYIRGLKELKNVEKGFYEEAVSKANTLVTTIQNSSIFEL
ncbi:MAG: hypothetical protein AAB507_01600, partial [Patescibacteria group bacterium]